MNKGVVYALFAAALFGASTPFSKALINQVAPVTLAGLLYLGSGIGLLTLFILRLLITEQNKTGSANLCRADLPWLGGAIIAGGIAAPVLLMLGLMTTPASTASLLLNMEGVFTALLAWFVFNENFDRRIFFGMILIVVASSLLSWEQSTELNMPWGSLAIIVACFCWAIDNNLTCKVSASDAVQTAGIKGLVAGVVNLTIAHLLGLPFPEINTALLACLIGFFGYGLSLVMFVLALRQLGTARTGAYFSVAPFAGAVIAFILLNETPSPVFGIATAFIGVGVWLHLTETHRHIHFHEPMFHTHSHSHDVHHQHTHNFPWDDKKSHSHPHQHEAQSHDHTHFPDIHHRH